MISTCLVNLISAIFIFSLSSGSDKMVFIYLVALMLQVAALLLQLGLYAAVQTTGALSGKVGVRVGTILGALGLFVACGSAYLIFFELRVTN